MTEQAAHLVDEVLPRVPVRQWVLTMPHRLRYLIAWNHRLCRAVLAVYVRAVLGHYRRRARRRGLEGAQGGAVTVIQRFGGGLNLNIHFHTLEDPAVIRRILTHLGLSMEGGEPLPARAPPEDAAHSRSRLRSASSPAECRARAVVREEPGNWRPVGRVGGPAQA